MCQHNVTSQVIHKKASYTRVVNVTISESTNITEILAAFTTIIQHGYHRE